MCKKQTAVSDSSAESEIILLDAGLRMGVLPALHILGMRFGNLDQVFRKVRP